MNLLNKICNVYLKKLFSLDDNYFTILWWFLPYIDTNWPQVYMCFPLPPPLPPHPSGLSRSTGFGCPASCVELALVIYITSVMNMFQSYSLKSSHPHLLPLSPKVWFFFCCPACRIISTVFLDSIICVNIQYLSFSFWLTSLRIIGSSFIHLIRTDSNVFLFRAE